MIKHYTDAEIMTALERASKESGIYHWTASSIGQLRAFLAALPERQVNNRRHFKAGETIRIGQSPTLYTVLRGGTHAITVRFVNGGITGPMEVDGATCRLVVDPAMLNMQQEAIDKAFEFCGDDWLTTNSSSEQWPKEAPARLAIAEAYDAARPQSAEIAKLKAELDKWHAEISLVMPDDFKDWHQNSPAKWPIVAAQVIRNLREREQSAIERAEKAEAELAALRQPILADDGRSLGQVQDDAWQASERDGKTAGECDEAAARAVVAAARPAIEAECLAQAVRRMEAVPVEELDQIYFLTPCAVYEHDDMGAVRARLIAAAKGDGQDIKGLEGLTKERCLRIAEIEGDSTVAAGQPPGLDPKGEAGKAKAPLALIPPEALRQQAWAHGTGAVKYGAWNWRDGRVCASTYVSAMMRHIAEYLDGVDADAESGLSPLAHVIASANILIDAKAHGTLDDDRPKNSNGNHESEFEAFERGEGVEA